MGFWKLARSIESPTCSVGDPLQIDADRVSGHYGMPEYAQKSLLISFSTLRPVAPDVYYVRIPEKSTMFCQTPHTFDFFEVSNLEKLTNSVKNKTTLQEPDTPGRDGI